MKIERAIEHAAKMLKTGKKHVWVDPEKTEQIKNAITKEDIKQLLIDRVIKKNRKKAQSRGRARKLMKKKQKGRKKGKGKRKGTKKARTEPKRVWISKVRTQRKTLKELKKNSTEKVKEKGYSKVYKMIKGGYFKGKKYLEQYIKG